MPNNYVLLQRIELNATAASVTFSNIPQSGYSDLKLVYSARTDRASVSSDIYMQFNGVTTATYSFRRLYSVTAPASDFVSNAANTGFVGVANGATSTASTFGNSEIYIPSYAGSNAKSWSADGVMENNAAASLMEIVAGLWSGTVAINSITIKDHNAASFVAGSTFSLYAMAAVGVTPAIAPKASGGSITSDGSFWYHTFKSSETFTPQVALTADCLVVAGGGSGGGQVGGGGGAGGYRLLTGQSFGAQSYACIVGAGGAGVNGASNPGNSGTNSSINSISATGGGGGGPNAVSPATAKNGGSGGGSGESSNYGTGNAGSYSPVEGYRGGSANDASYYGSGGGGGAGAIGGDGTTSVGGNGGAGSNSASSWASATGTGVSGFYAGGGGGSILNPATKGSGGSGGGGAGAVLGGAETATSGTVNTGSGGGGQGSNSGSLLSGAGGSGIVIIRYSIA